MNVYIKVENNEVVDTTASKTMGNAWSHTGNTVYKVMVDDKLDFDSIRQEAIKQGYIDGKPTRVVFSWDFEEIDDDNISTVVYCNLANEVDPMFNELTREHSIPEIRNMVKRYAKKHGLDFVETTEYQTATAYKIAKLQAAKSNH